MHGDNSRTLYNSDAVKYFDYKRTRLFNVFYNNANSPQELTVRNLDEHIAKKRVIKTELTAKYNDSDKTIDVSVIAKKIKNGGELKSKNLSVLLWVTENNINSYQYFLYGYNYINHQHVLRGSLNDLWGKPYQLGNTYTLKANLPKDVINANNCEVIAIILDTNTKQFIDSVRIKLQ